MAVLDHVLESLKCWPSTPCFIELRPKCTPKIVAADQLLSNIESIGRLVESWGVSRGCLVPLFLDNSMHFVTAFLGLLKVGAVPVLSKMDYRSLELEEIFNNASPQAVISESSHLMHLKDFLGKRTVISHEDGDFQILQHSTRMQQTDSVANQIASINYTYRGYGYPLGAMIPQDQYLYGARGFQDCLLSKPGDKILALLPMQHIYTLVSAIFFPLLHHLTSVLAHTLHPRMIFEYINTYKIEFVTTVPEVFNLLYRSAEQVSELAAKIFVSGGSVLTPEAYHRIRERFGVEFLNGYGLTEYTPATGNIRGSSKAGTIGQPCFGTEININNANTDGIGEIFLYSRHMCKEYYHRCRETKEAHSGKWLKTGDLGKFDGDHIVFVGEKKKTHKVNGNMVDLVEVQRALLRHPQIKHAEISSKGNAIKARIALRSRTKDNRKDWLSIRASLRDTIAEYKLPTSIEII